jgi:hypothetical protein
MVMGVVVGAVVGYAIAAAFLWTAFRFEAAFRKDAERAAAPQTQPRRAA